MLQRKALPITRRDYESMREGPPYYQVIEGDLIMSPSPNKFHQQILLRITYLIEHFLQKHPVGELFVAPFDTFLSDTNVFQPDIIFVANDRHGIATEHGIEGAPNLVVEILSPGTEAHDRGAKRMIYARTGVEELCLVNPGKQEVQVYHLREDAESPVATHGPGATFSSELLPGLKIRTSEIFRSTRQKGYDKR